MWNCCWNRPPKWQCTNSGIFKREIVVGIEPLKRLFEQSSSVSFVHFPRPYTACVQQLWKVRSSFFAQENTGQDNTRQANTRQDKTRRDNATRQDTPQHETRRAKPIHDKTRQHKKTHDKTVQHKTVQLKTVQNNTGWVCVGGGGDNTTGSYCEKSLFYI